MQYFLPFCFCDFPHVLVCVLRICLFACLLTFLLFCIIYIFPCSLYFLQSFCALLNCYFQTNCSYLHLLNVCRLLAVKLSRFGQLAFTLNWFFWCHRPNCIYISLCLNYFAWLLGFCCFFFDSFGACFFCSADQLDTYICACSFSFFLAPLFVFLSPPYSYPSISYREPLPSPLFLRMILSSHHDHPCTLPVFFRCVHALQNMSSSTICWSFFLVFASLLTHASICTHPNRSTPICKHTHHFSPNSQKHHVRGKFPGHRAQILPCMTLNAPCLPCFCVSRAPCIPTHPCAPIRTHSNPFLPVFTLNRHTYMYNLIKKLV